MRAIRRHATLHLKGSSFLLFLDFVMLNFDAALGILLDQSSKEAHNSSRSTVCSGHFCTRVLPPSISRYINILRIKVLWWHNTLEGDKV